MQDSDSQPIRISALGPHEREIVAHHRFKELAKHLRAAGCAVTPDEVSLALNFHTGHHMLTVQLDRDDPRRIELALRVTQSRGDIAKARWACFEATSKQFASKATVYQHGEGFMLALSVGVYAETLAAFGDSLKAYVEDVVKLYVDWLDLMAT